MAAQWPSDEVLLGGERGGLAVPGFDLGNSPDDYTADRLDGKTLIITTTNGTRAMAHARTAAQIFLGAFVNISALCEKLQGDMAIHILCSGTDGQYSEDDILLAGMLVDRLQRRDGQGYMLNAQAITAQETWLHAFPLPLVLGAETLEPDRLAKALRNSPGGRNLVELGLDEDILTAADRSLRHRARVGPGNVSDSRRVGPACQAGLLRSDLIARLPFASNSAHYQGCDHNLSYGSREKLQVFRRTITQ